MMGSNSLSCIAPPAVRFRVIRGFRATALENWRYVVPGRKRYIPRVTVSCNTIRLVPAEVTNTKLCISLPHATSICFEASVMFSPSHIGHISITFTIGDNYCMQYITLKKGGQVCSVHAETPRYWSLSAKIQRLTQKIIMTGA